MRNTISKVFCLVFLLLFAAAAGQADYLTVPACAFHGYYTDPSSVYFVATSSNAQWIYTLTQPGDAGYCYAPVNLPQGARISGIILYYLDNDAGANIEVRLQKHTQSVLDSYKTLFSVTTYGASNWINTLGDWTLNEGTRIVGNNGFQYCLRLQFQAATDQLKCFGVKIIYTMP